MRSPSCWWELLNISLPPLTPRLSATLFLIGFNLSKQLSGVVLSAWVGRMYDTVGFHQAYLILGCITLSFTLLSFVTLRGGNRLLPTAETQSPA